jgi:hypothetical protein
MHPGTSLTELGDQIVQQNSQKRDFVAPANRLRVEVDDKSPKLRFSTAQHEIRADITGHALRQLAAFGDIPVKYLDKIRSVPPLLEDNLNHWLRESSEPRMLRTLWTDAGPVTRAFLSSRYRPLDNFSLAERCLPQLQAAGASIKSCALTETRFYLQAVTERISREVKPGDVVQAGVVISNSEVGAGALRIEPLVYRLICSNGAVIGTTMRKYHIGRDLDHGGENIHEVLTDATKTLIDEALWSKVKDVLTAALDEARFDRIVERLRAASTTEAGRNPQEIVELTASTYGLSQEERDSVMRHLFAGGDLTLFGLGNAVTRTAQDVTDYDRAVELERVGGEIFGLKPLAFSRN